MLDYVILGFLNWEPMTGYDIKQAMSKTTAYFCNASFGSIYPILKKLEAKGWATNQGSIENGKFRKVYYITEIGKHALLAWLREPPAGDLSEMLARMLFYSLLPKEETVPLIAHYISQAEKVRAELDRMDDEWNETDPVKKAALQFGRDYYAFQNRWFQEFINRIQQEEKTPKG